MSKKSDKVDVHTGKDGQLKIYRRIDHETGKVGCIWYFNIAIRGQRQIRYRSTKTVDLPRAMTIADAEYARVAMRVASGVNVASFSFKRVAQEAVAHYERLCKVGDLPVHRFDRLRRTLENIYIPYFEDRQSKDFVEINALDIEDLLLWRRSKGQMHKTKKIDGKPLFLPNKPSAPATINVELQMLRMVYAYAVKRQLILAGQVPPIRSLKSRPMDTRRPHFTLGEWSRVTNYLHYHYLNEIPKSVGNFKRLYEFYREQNKHLWLMLAHSMCRVGEMRQLRWGQIEFRKVRDPRRDNEHVERVILLVNGKTGRRSVICQPYAKLVIRRWQDICIQYGVLTAPGAFVFRHPHFTNKGKDYVDKPIDTTNQAFQVVLRRLELDTDVEGRRRSVYSIRHSAITWALQGNVNAVSVAKNAGTGLDMIQKFYDHSLSTDYISELTKFDVTGADDR